MPILQNAKHEAVIQQFVADRERIGWRAYSAVYKGSSQRAAETAWSRLLKRAEFAARLSELKAGIAEAVVSAAVMDLQEVLGELSKLGRSNMKRFISVGGDSTADVITSLQDLDDADAAAIQELTVETYVEGHGDDARDVKRVRLKLHNKHAALAELRRHHEPDKHEMSGKVQTEEIGENGKLDPLELARRIAFALEQGARQAAKIPAKAPAKRAAKPKGAT